MTKHILRCPECMKYTMKEQCDACQVSTVESKPPKYSPEDKYGRYRREAKEQEYRNKGLL